MRLAIETIAYQEERMIPKFIQLYQDRVDTILVLNTSKPWFGGEGKDNTASIARSLGAEVIEYDWKTEEEQRNAGLDYLSDYDWVLILDPDEYIDDKNWSYLLDYLEGNEISAHVVDHQFTYWKNGWVADPPRDYQMLIAVKPTEVRFVDKRVINSGYAVAPIFLHHFSWAKTDEEILGKITHYAHAQDFDVKDWYENVWLRWRPGMIDVHPTTPETLHELIVAQLPPEIDRLDLWP